MRQLILNIDNKYLNNKIKNTILFLMKMRTFSFFHTKNFILNDRTFPFFYHKHNVGNSYFRLTERSIELRLAKLFIDNYGGKLICEIGAVSCYYWPDLVKTIVDPADKSVYVTHKQDWNKFKLSSKTKAILSISTFEHIGKDDYNHNIPKNPKSNTKAFEKVFNSKLDFLITVPGGYNNEMEEYLKKRLKNSKQENNIKFFVIERGKFCNNWKSFDTKKEFNFEYGPFWANYLLIIYRMKNDIF